MAGLPEENSLSTSIEFNEYPSSLTKRVKKYALTISSSPLMTEIVSAFLIKLLYLICLFL